MAFKKIYKEKLKLSIDGSVLKMSNLILSENGKRTNLTADVSALATTIVVANYEDLADDDYLLVGEWGEPTAEIKQIGAAVTTSSVTIAALVYDHYTDTPVTVIPCDKIQFYRAVTLVDPNDAGVVTQLGSDVAIMAYRKDTIYNDATNTTGYGYARFMKSQATAAYSEYTVGVAYEGNAYNSIEEICKEAVNLVGVEIGDVSAKEDQLLKDANQAQNIITKTQDWVFELISNDTSIASTENEYKYALSGLTYAMKHPNSKQGIMNVKFGTALLKYRDWHEFESNFEGAALTTAGLDAAIAAVTLTLTDSYEFAASGTIYSGSNSVTYTVNTESTGVLSGISASGDYSIETAITSGDNVWQGLKPGVPEEYSIFDGNVYLDVPVETDEVGKKIKFKYLKTLTRFTDFSNTTDIPFYDALQYYIAHKIEIRRENFDLAKEHKNAFMEIVSLNREAYKMPMMEQMEYYAFGFSGSNDNDSNFDND